ncbi:hypothetical protein C8J56DRAFT_1022209 [Mycena floridula]|nr:hypothetical protein C8J56DRAFT_1022209 [Mycena floridula]
MEQTVKEMAKYKLKTRSMVGTPLPEPKKSKDESSKSVQPLNNTPIGAQGPKQVEPQHLEWVDHSQMKTSPRMVILPLKMYHLRWMRIYWGVEDAFYWTSAYKESIIRAVAACLTLSRASLTSTHLSPPRPNLHLRGVLHLGITGIISPHTPAARSNARRLAWRYGDTLRYARSTTSTCNHLSPPPRQNIYDNFFSFFLLEFGRRKTAQKESGAGPETQHVPHEVTSRHENLGLANQITFQLVRSVI